MYGIYMLKNGKNIVFPEWNTQYSFKILILLKLIYKLNITLIKIPENFLRDINKPILK